MSVENLQERRELLRQRLTDREYSDQYADSLLFETVSTQVQALRRQRGMTQEQLAARIRSKQPRISNVESHSGRSEWPNWEVATLNRIAHALGTRLKITFESHGSMVQELGTVTSESLRKPEYQNDPVLFPLPVVPLPDQNAPERTRWMQELLIPWLWADELGLERLYGWLNGRGLPPVGHDEEPYEWLLRGMAIRGPARDHLEKRFAERLAIVLGEEPDLAMGEGGEDFLRNLYWTCAGIAQPGFLAEQLWKTYQRLGESKLRGDVRDALQAALVRNQNENKFVARIWDNMVDRGRHRGLRGGEIVGYEGILARHATVRKDLDKVLWALSRIAQRWDSSKKADFRRLMLKVPDLDRFEVAKRLIASAHDNKNGWSQWAREVLPILSFPESRAGSLTVSVVFDGTEVYAAWPANGLARTGVRRKGSPGVEQMSSLRISGQPRPLVLLNALLTSLGSDTHASEMEQRIAHALVFEHLVKLRSADREQISKQHPATDSYAQPNAEVEAALLGAELLRGIQHQLAA
jgi:transcriptional regulator with XRE-family HTH domain